MSIYDKVYPSSSHLPPPEDCRGDFARCTEFGTDQVTVWLSCGGDITPAYWQPLGDSYTGPWATRPSAGDMRDRARMWITDIGAVLETSGFVYTGGRLEKKGGRFRPQHPIVLLDCMGPADAALGTSGAASLANGASSAIALPFADPTLPVGFLQIGNRMRSEVVGKRTAGTTNSLGLQIAQMIDGVVVLGAPFNAASSTAETGAEGLSIVTGATTLTVQALDMVAAQSTNGYANTTIADLTTGALTLSAARVNGSGGAVTDNLSLFVNRLTLIG